ncbi:MAG: hypothetical protein EOP11_17345 [Proteobacteria bacterium]|nr:MAG: hypothetical protein EOP11_17345 [Pseudomonadota bacterium]
MAIASPDGLASADPTPYVNARSVEAERALRRISSADFASLRTDEEKVKWASARLAWVSLLRLQSRDEEALKVFGECAGFCEKFGPKGEWKAAKAWGCGKNPALIPCGKKAK